MAVDNGHTQPSPLQAPNSYSDLVPTPLSVYLELCQELF